MSDGKVVGLVWYSDDLEGKDFDGSSFGLCAGSLRRQDQDQDAIRRQLLKSHLLCRHRAPPGYCRPRRRAKQRQILSSRSSFGVLESQAHRAHQIKFPETS
jgi:hypothetical protein